jgi:hypothetical protein
MISFKQATSLGDIEDAYRKLSGEPGAAIRIPGALRHGGGFGIPAALIQFFAAWSRASDNSLLKLYASDAPEASLAAFAQEPQGMAALYFASKIEYSNFGTEPSKVGLAHAIPRIEAMQSGKYRQTMHGRGAFLACFAGAKNEFLMPLYSTGEKGSLRGREDFAHMTERVIDSCAPAAMRHLTPMQFHAISNLIYELFRNTDEHAQTDENGDRYHRNIRGLMAKFISKSKSTIAADTTGKDVPQNIFMLRTLSNTRRTKSASDTRLRAVSDATFLELTVFDTGPGLARRWMSKHAPNQSLENIDIDLEMQYVKHCFEQHATTKDSDESGHGLSLVVTALREVNAFLRLRTGRVCLYQDFSSASATSFAPKHWLRERPELEVVPGAAYSIIIPLSRGEQ